MISTRVQILQVIRLCVPLYGAAHLPRAAHLREVMASPGDADESNPPLKREREGDEDMDGLGDASGEGRYSNRSKYKCGLCGQVIFPSSRRR